MHMEHGSRVTTSEQSVSRHEPAVSLARLMASISACAVASCRISTSLCARLIILPSATITAPTGTSPRAAAFSASVSA